MNKIQHEQAGKTLYELDELIGAELLHVRPKWCRAGLVLSRCQRALKQLRSHLDDLYAEQVGGEFDPKVYYPGGYPHEND